MAEVYKTWRFDVEGVKDPETYAPGFPYVTSTGRDEAEAREKAKEYLEEGESVGKLLTDSPD